MSKTEQRQREWAVHIADYKASGLTMAAWCTANNVSVEKFKYWKRKLKSVSPSKATPPAAHFVPIAVSEPSKPSTCEVASSLVVCVGSVRIELRKGFDPVLLREAVEALSAPC